MVQGGTWPHVLTLTCPSGGLEQDTTPHGFQFSPLQNAGRAKRDLHTVVRVGLGRAAHKTHEVHARGLCKGSEERHGLEVPVGCPAADPRTPGGSVHLAYLISKIK